MNLMAFRATKPEELVAQADAVGPANHRTLRDACATATCVVAAWGVHSATQLPGAIESARIVREAAAGRLHCLRRTKHGAPAHPLYLPKTAALAAWP